VKEKMMFGIGIALIAVGVLYLVKPNIFQRWFWKRTAISQRLLTPEQNKIYMRVLGGLFVIIGIVLLAAPK
jgi:uncharacterized membrane protein HdeD (DUF308 family)